MVATSLLFIGSCSTDVEEEFPDDLSIESQIPKVKRASPELNDNGIPKEKDECALYALMLIKGGTKGDYWKKNNIEPNDYYKRLKDCAIEFGYEGGPMDSKIVEKVGQEFGLISGYHTFSETPGQFFLNQEDYFYLNHSRIKMLNFPGHTAKLLSYNPGSKMVKYEDGAGVDECSVFKVTSVYFK